MKEFFMKNDKNFDNIDDQDLRKELEDFYNQKQKLKRIVEKKAKQEMLFNISFLLIVVCFFLIGAVFKHIDPTLSLEIAILLVSLKMVWMIYEQQKANHFFFWILTSLEHEVNQLHISIYKKNKKKPLAKKEA